MAKYLYIPMEIFDREIDGNCLLAVEATKRGWMVVLAGKSEIFKRIRRFPKGVYLLKSVVPGEVHIQDEIRSEGSRVACLDQEGLLQREGLEYKLRFNEETIDKTDLVFFWGPSQKEHFNEVFESPEQSKLRVSGSPRADYWIIAGEHKPTFSKYLQKWHKPKFKDYVFFPTSFGNINHALGKYGQKNILSGVANVGDAQDEVGKVIMENADARKALAAHMIEIYREILISLAEQLPDTMIVLRPHPSENIDWWRDVIRGFDNIVIETTGATTDWIVGAKCVVQYGSTIAIESALLKVPVVACVPNLPDKIRSLNLKYPEMVSCTAETAQETVELIKGFVTGNKIFEPFDLTRLSDVIQYTPGSLSSKAIVDGLDTLDVDDDRPLKVDRLQSVNRNSLMVGLKTRLLIFLLTIPGIRSLVPVRFRHMRHRTAYGKRKAYQMDASVLQAKVDAMAVVSGEEPGACIVQHLGENVFQFSAK